RRPTARLRDHLEVVPPIWVLLGHRAPRAVGERIREGFLDLSAPGPPMRELVSEQAAVGPPVAVHVERPPDPGRTARSPAVRTGRRDLHESDLRGGATRARFHSRPELLGLLGQLR